MNSSSNDRRARSGFLAAIGLAALFGAPAVAQQAQPAAAPAAAPASAWSIMCDRAETCRMETAITGDQGKTIAMLAIRKPTPDGRQLGEMILPLGLHIPSGVAVQIDEGDAFPAELIACGPGGCHAIFEATALVLASMRNGYDFKTRLVNARTLKPVGLKFSLIGFTKTSKDLAAR